MAKYRVKLGKNVSVSSRGLRVGGKVGKKGPYISVGSSGTFVGGTVGPVRYSHFSSTSTPKKSSSKKASHGNSSPKSVKNPRAKETLPRSVSSVNSSSGARSWWRPKPAATPKLKQPHSTGAPKELPRGVNIVCLIVSLLFVAMSVSLLFNQHDREDIGIVPLLIMIVLWTLLAVRNGRAAKRKARGRKKLVKCEASGGHSSTSVSQREGLAAPQAQEPLADARVVSTSDQANSANNMRFAPEVYRATEEVDASGE